MIISRIGTYLMIGALIISLLYILDPTQSIRNAPPFLKYFPAELSLAAWLMFLPLRTVKPKRDYYFLLGFFFLMISGSLATIAQGASPSESFFGRGLGMISFFAAYRMFSSDKETLFFLKFYLPAFFLAGLFITVSLIVWFSGFHFIKVPHIYHVQIFIPATASVIWYFLIDFPMLKSWGTILFLSSCVFSQKNSGYLAGMLSIAMIMMLIWRRRGKKTQRKLRRISIILMAIIVAFSVIFIFKLLGFSGVYTYLPSGSPGVRFHTYSARISDFLDSPFFGSYFFGSPLITLPTSQGEITIPSHSDILDILAYGGLFGAALFLIPITRLIARELRKSDKMDARFYWHHVCSVVIIINLMLLLTFNSPYVCPEIMFFFWISAGFLFASQGTERKRLAK